MSIENAKKFIAKVGDDSELKAKLLTCTSPEERFAVAKDLGYAFTAAQLNQAKTELTDRELDAIAGGRCCGYTCEGDSSNYICNDSNTGCFNN